MAFFTNDGHHRTFTKPGFLYPIEWDRLFLLSFWFIIIRILLSLHMFLLVCLSSLHLQVHLCGRQMVAHAVGTAPYNCSMQRLQMKRMGFEFPTDQAFVQTISRHFGFFWSFRLKFQNDFLLFRSEILESNVSKWFSNVRLFLKSLNLMFSNYFQIFVCLGVFASNFQMISWYCFFLNCLKLMVPMISNYWFVLKSLNLMFSKCSFVQKFLNLKLSNVFQIFVCFPKSFGWSFWMILPPGSPGADWLLPKKGG